MHISISRVDYSSSQQAHELTSLLNDYAQDPMGGNAALSAQALEDLCPQLALLDHAHSFICYVDNKPAGFINCFEGFSTFKAQKLLNIHDVYIDATYRGLGISKKLLKQAEQLAKELKCCKITLEVLAGNTIAQQAYSQFGFEAGSNALSPTYFWQKTLN